MPAPCEMKMLEVKTVRFAVLIEKCGVPEVYTLWQKVATDRRFQSLLKKHRIVTIQKTESGTDFGVADFCERKSATYLAFPKSVLRFADRRIVGINWELITR
ncbi:MAG: hypothetical protein ABI883_03930 [Chthoniobacterales bacterium]